MPIPQTRDELTEQITSAWSRLEPEIASLSESDADTVCVDTWTVKQLLAVRAWWSERVVEWVKMGRRGEIPHLPAPGYQWTETPRLNASIAREASEVSFEDVRRRLSEAFRSVMAVIEELDDDELLRSGEFEWAGKWPLSRWLSINTTRQYVTARTFIRRALRA